MTCTPLPGGGFACSRGPRPRCTEVGCSAPSVALCDFELWRKDGKFGGETGRATCDRRLCRRHAIRQPGLGADGSAERDYCPSHHRLSQVAVPVRGAQGLWEWTSP